MAKNNEMIRHWVAAIRRFKPIAQLNGFAESGLGEVHVINVSPFAGSRWSGTLFTGSGLCALSLNECDRRQGK